MSSPHKKTYAEAVTGQQTRRPAACRKAEAATSTFKARNSPPTGRDLPCSQNQDLRSPFNNLSPGTNHPQINEFQVGIQLGEILAYARHQRLSQGNQAQIQQNLVQDLHELQELTWQVVDSQNLIIDAQNRISMDLGVIKAMLFRIQPDHGGPLEGLSNGLYARQMAAPPGFENCQ
ncbi:hypothetical protein TWF569_000235 [Orbilia oligospora]|nr:hypothetical protein TWF751_002932 [Orbilia oligospora]KAF3157670.1 hypothetical protein TWF569_000235 [Orbilia oligospora]